MAFPDADRSGDNDNVSDSSVTFAEAAFVLLLLLMVLTLLMSMLQTLLIYRSMLIKH